MKKKVLSTLLAFALVFVECAMPMTARAETEAKEEVLLEQTADVEQPEAPADETTEEVMPASAEFAESKVARAGSSMADATSFPMNSSTSGYITDDVSKDFYKLVLPSSGKLNLKFDGNIEYVSFYFYDEEGKELWTDTWHHWNSTSEKNTLDDTTNLTKGTYYFAIKETSGSGSYTLKNTFESANETFEETGYGTNNTLNEANAIGFNNTYKGQIAYNDTKDFYRLVVPSSGRLHLKFDGGMENISFYFYNDEGKQIWNDTYHSWNSVTKRNILDDLTDLTKGTYYFAISRTSYSGNYTLNASFESAGESFEETGYGVNNELAKAQGISLAKTYKGQIAYNDDCDFYCFTKANNSEIMLTFDGGIEKLHFYVYNKDGNSVWKKTYHYWNSTSQRNTLQEKLAIPAGTYYLAIEKCYGTGNYSFSLGGSTTRGWKKQGSYWYYYNNAGIAVTGWQYIGKEWYCFNNSGVMLNSWQQIEGQWYYFRGGAMQKGWQRIGNLWYYFNGSGHMKTGWQKLGGKWYFMRDGGSMVTGWRSIGGKWYYFNGSGVMVTGKVKIGAKVYNFNSSGVCTNPY